MQIRPIPILDWTSNAGSYKDERFDPSDLRSGEPLVNVNDYGLAADSYYARTNLGNPPYNCVIKGSLPDVWCRRSVAEKLVRANALLRLTGAELLILDAYRPIACQQGLWDFFSAQAKRDMPDATEAERRDWTLTYVSDPSFFNKDDPRTWPTHSTGAAVDVTLRDLATKQQLDLGTGFDEMSPRCHADYFEREHTAGRIHSDNTPLHNRRVLFAAMTTEGFVNYPNEFWHFDWGNQMFIYNLRAMGGTAPAAAWFGYADMPA